MKLSPLIVVSLWTLLPSATVALKESAGSDAAVQKVIEMLNDMLTTAKNEKQAEEITFAKFKTWCAEGPANLKNSIKQSGEKITTLTAGIQKLENDAAGLGDEIAKLQSGVASAEAELKSATAQHDKDSEAYAAEAQDFAESVDALERAIQVLQKQNYDRSALLQVSEQLPAQAKDIITAFMADGGDGLSYEAPEANAYEFQSGGIVSMLKKLKDDFTQKLGESQKEAMNAKHAYDMVAQDLSNFVDDSKSDIDEKSVVKQRKQEKAALDKKLLSETTANKKEDEEMLGSMSTQCAEKKLSFDEKQQLRAEEIEAIAKAVEILSSPDAAGNAEKHLSFAQVRVSATSLVQNTEEDQAAGIKHRVADFLEAEAKRQHSATLGQLAEQVAADPFAKVRKLISDMINRLMEEANADAEHEGFCDTEMGKSKNTRSKLSEQIDALSAAIEDGKATAMVLTEDIARLDREVAELDEAMKEATDMRQEEKAKASETVSDAKAAQKAVKAAVSVLKDFYSRASEATALVQTSEADAPGHIRMGTDEWASLANPNFKGTVDKGHKSGMQTFGKTYKGQQSRAGGVLAMLSVIQSDFEVLQADTEAAEAEAKRKYQQFMADSKRDKAAKARKSELSVADKASAEARMRSDTNDLKATQDQLLAAERYHERLVPQCVDKGMTYDEKVAARQSEITSLKEALRILSGEDIATTAL